MGSNTKTVAFIGASIGVGLAALKHTLAAGHQCIALCRFPEKLEAVFPPGSAPNLRILQGNAHDVEAVSKCIQTEGGKLVDNIVSTIGSRPELTNLRNIDAKVCRKGMATLLEALSLLRSRGIHGSPHITVCSTTGMSRFGRDTPIAIVPLYSVLLKVPHQDKTIMEDQLAASGESFTIIRCSLMVNGETSKPVRVGIEDPKTGRESSAIGYTISREAVGKWVANSLILKNPSKYTNKIAMLTH